MTYDDLITPPPTSIDDRDDAVRRNEVYDRIEAIVTDHATAHEGDPVGLYDGFALTIRVRIPFRITAYRHDIDREACERHDVDPESLPIRETDGWVDISEPAYVTIDFAHHTEEPKQVVEDVEEDALTDFAFDGMVNGVFESLREGKASKPLTTEVVERVEIEEPVPRRQTDVDPTDGKAYREEFRTVRVGTARYKVDGIVPPEHFDGGAE